MDRYDGQDLQKISERAWQNLSTSVTPNKPLGKLWAIARTIQEINPDVLCLNEVGGLESLQNFNHHFLKNSYEPYLIEGNSPRGIDVGYLLKKGHAFRPLLISHKDRPIDFLYPHETEGPGKAKSHYFSRDVAELRLFSPQTKSPELVILLTHLKSKLDPDLIDHLGKKRREAELKALVRIYTEVRKELPGCPVLVCGDMNGVAQKASFEAEFQALYESTDLIEPFGELGLEPSRCISQVQISNNQTVRNMQIDYIFVSPEILPGVIKENCGTYYFKNELGVEDPLPRNLDERLRLPSDHYPMILEIAWPLTR